MPERRVRPSLLTPASKLFGLLSAGSSMVIGKDYTNIILYSMEKGIQVNYMIEVNRI